MTLDPCDPCGCIPGYIGENEFFQKVLQAQCQILDLIGGGAEFTPPSDCLIDLGTALKRFKDIYLCGNVILSAASAKVIPGATSLLFRNHADSADNLTITDAGLVSVVRSNLGITAGNLVFGAAASKIVPGATSLSLRNNADSASNLTITDAGLVSIVRDNLAITAGNLVFGAAASKIVPGATSLSLRNNADSADNLLVTDVGSVTLRNNTGAFLNVPKDSYLGATTTTLTDIDAILGASSRVNVLFDATTNGGLVVAARSNNTNGALVEFFMNKDLTGWEATTIVANGDRLGRLNFFGSNGTTYSQAASIVVTVDGTPGASNDMPGAIDFQVSPDGSATPASALKISNSGKVTLASATGGLVLSQTGGNVTPILSGTSAIDTDISNLTGTHVNLEVVNTSETIISVANTATATGSYLSFFKTRATAPATNADTIVASGDEIGRIRFFGADGTNYRLASQIIVTVDGTPGASDMPGAMDFQVSPDGSATPASALKITNDKVATFAGAIKTAAAQESTGAGTALLGTNSPASTLSAPYKWLKFITSDGSTVYVPAWK